MNKRGDIRLTFFVAYGITLLIGGAIIWNMSRMIVELRTPSHVAECRGHVGQVQQVIDVFQCQDRIFVGERP